MHLAVAAAPLANIKLAILTKADLEKHTSYMALTAVTTMLLREAWYFMRMNALLIMKPILNLLVIALVARWYLINF